MKVRAHLYVKGRVQGVGYRAFVVRTAESNGLCGWVKNLPDRSVEAVFEGEKTTIEKAIEILRKGPPAAHVSSVDVNWTTSIEGLSGFSVRY